MVAEPSVAVHADIENVKCQELTNLPDTGNVFEEIDEVDDATQCTLLIGGQVGQACVYADVYASRHWDPDACDDEGRCPNNLGGGGSYGRSIPLVAWQVVVTAEVVFAGVSASAWRQCTTYVGEFGCDTPTAEGETLCKRGEPVVFSTATTTATVDHQPLEDEARAFCE